jgi:hypothetical protein
VTSGKAALTRRHLQQIVVWVVAVTPLLLAAAVIITGFVLAVRRG